jgi:hypothetical protein
VKGNAKISIMAWNLARQLQTNVDLRQKCLFVVAGILFSVAATFSASDSPLNRHFFVVFFFVRLLVKPGLPSAIAAATFGWQGFAPLNGGQWLLLRLPISNGYDTRLFSAPGQEAGPKQEIQSLIHPN